MRRAVLVPVVLGLLVLAGLAPGAIDAGVPEGRLEVTSATLACPELPVTDDSTAIVAANVDPEAAAGRPGAAGLARIDDPAAVVSVTEPGAPIALVATRSQPSILATADDAWAPGLVAGAATRDVGGPASGMASVACPAPAADWWFVGPGSQVDRGSALLVSNPSPEPARIDLTMYSGSGEVPVLAGSGVDLAPRASVRLRLDALAPGQELLAVHVAATVGRVAVACWDTGPPSGDTSRGVDYLSRSVAPRTDLVIPGVPGIGARARSLTLVNPGDRFATVSLRLATESGTEALTDLTEVAVPARSVTHVDAGTALGPRSGSLLLTSDLPVTASVRSSWGNDQVDVAWTSAAPMVDSDSPLAAAGAVPAGPGIVASVTVVAPAGAVQGTLSWRSNGDAADSIFAPDGGPLAHGADPGALDAAGPGLLPLGPSGSGQQVITVPAGAQRTVAVPEMDRHALSTFTWRSDPGSGPAGLAHLVRNESVPLITGYAWWPTTSLVPAAVVREDLGTLLPGGR